MQVCGFESPKDAPVCCAYAPGVGRREIACGFDSGALRVFDASTIALLKACHGATQPRDDTALHCTARHNCVMILHSKSAWLRTQLQPV